MIEMEIVIKKVFFFPIFVETHVTKKMTQKVQTELIDPNQPRISGASSFLKFRHYVNLDKTASKISSFIDAFSHCTFTTCRQYLEEVTTDDRSET